MSIYSMGVYIGILVGYGVGGWINQHYGWRVAFFAVGIPGILIGLLVKLTIREPLRGLADGNTQSEQPSLKETLSILWQLQSFRFFTVAADCPSTDPAEKEAMSFFHLATVEVDDSISARSSGCEINHCSRHQNFVLRNRHIAPRKKA